MRCRLDSYRITMAPGRQPKHAVPGPMRVNVCGMQQIGQRNGSAQRHPAHVVGGRIGFVIGKNLMSFVSG
jgi:hypothetical protein